MNEEQFLNNREYICAYCLSKNEDRLCDDYSQICDKVNVLRNDYSDYLEDCLTDKFDKKQNLIKCLEDKIIQCNENIKNLTSLLEVEDISTEVKKDLHIAKIVKRNYQEILDKLKEGKYD